MAKFEKMRWTRMILAIGCILLFIAVIGWFYAVPQYRPKLKSGETYGIDVSSHQHTINWTQVADDHISFVYIKASEGSGTQDAMFKSYWEGATKAGLKTGAYHYFSLCSSGKTQAQNYLKVIAGKKQALPPALDLEFSPYCTEHPSASHVVAEINDYVATVHASTQVQPVIYVGGTFDKTYHIKSRLKGDDFWQLRYLRRPIETNDTLWQVGNFFDVSGVPGKVDLDIRM